MARRRNKAQAIRSEFEKQGHDARPRDIVAALAARKIKVSPTQVSNIKSKLNGQKSASESSDLVSLASLRAAKTLIEAAGSPEEAKKTIDALASLR
jgi:hypothetical protein